MLRFFKNPKEAKELSKADKVLRRLLECEVPSSQGSAYCYHARAYEKVGRYDVAIADYTKAIEICNEYRYNYLLDRGRAYYKAGDFTAAIADFTASIERAPAYHKTTHAACCLYNRAMAKEKRLNFKFEDVMSDIHEAFRLDPSREKILSCYKQNHDQHSVKLKAYLVSQLNDLLNRQEPPPPAPRREEPLAPVATAQSNLFGYQPPNNPPGYNSWNEFNRDAIKTWKAGNNY